MSVVSRQESYTEPQQGLESPRDPSRRERVWASVCSILESIGEFFSWLGSFLFTERSEEGLGSRTVVREPISQDKKKVTISSFFDFEECRNQLASQNLGIQEPFSLVYFSDSFLKEDGGKSQATNALLARYDIIQVKGDGHCLFRAILTQLGRGSPEQKAAIADRFQGLRKEFKTDQVLVGEWSHEIDAKLDSMTDYFSGSSFPLEPEDRRVEELRILACYWNLTHCPETFESELLAEEKSIDLYFGDMVNMEKGEYGGDPELLALAKALQVEIVVIKEELQKGAKIIELRREPLNQALLEIPLFLRSLHYNCLVEKSNKRRTSA